MSTDSPINTLRDAYHAIPAGWPAAEEVFAKLPTLYAAIDAVLDAEGLDTYVKRLRAKVEGLEVMAWDNQGGITVSRAAVLAAIEEARERPEDDRG